MSTKVTIPRVEGDTVAIPMKRKQANGDDFDLSGFTVTCLVHRPADAARETLTCTLLTATEGTYQVDVGTGLLTEEGECSIEIKFDDGSGGIETFPKSDEVLFVSVRNSNAAP